MGRFFAGLSIRNKILLGNALVLVLFVLGMGTAVSLLYRVDRSTRHLQDEILPSLADLAEIRSAGIRLLGETQNMVTLVRLADAEAGHVVGTRASKERAAGERGQMRAARDQLATTYANLRSVSRLQDLHTPEAHRTMLERLDRLGRLIATLIDDAERIEQQLDVMPSEQVMPQFDTLEEHEEEFEAAVQQARDAMQQEAAEVQTAIDRWLSLGLQVSAAVLLGGIALGALAAFRIARRIAGPLRQLRDAAQRVGAGEFDVVGLRATGDETGELAAAFEKMAQDLKDSMERQAQQNRFAALGELAGTVNHELRNPLATISNSLFTLRRHVPAAQAETAKLIDRIERNVERCITVVGDFLDFARPPMASRGPVALDAWLADLLDEYALPPGIGLDRQLGSGMCVALDGERFRRAIINLLDNAVQAMTTADAQRADDGSGVAPQGRLTVRTAFDGEAVTVAVSDTGSGIPADIVERVFEPLFTTKSFGVGLGLPAARRIVEQHDGIIVVESPPGSGACFRISLVPLRAEPKGAAA